MSAGWSPLQAAARPIDFHRQGGVWLEQNDRKPAPLKNFMRR
jgi:hypothetical protein